jgi:uncharacterized protein (TIGR03083 family)
MDREELHQQMVSGRQQFKATLARLTDTEMSAPFLLGNWSVKDMLAHIAWWEMRVLKIYQTLLKGETVAPIFEDVSIDALNARIYAEHRHRDLAEIIQEEEQTYQDLLSLVQTAPERDLFDPGRFSWTEEKPFALWVVWNTYDHYAEHSADLSAHFTR